MYTKWRNVNMFGMFSNWGPIGDFADVGNVIDDDTTGGEAGTYAEIEVAKVQAGEQYGEDGTEHTGELAVTGAIHIFWHGRF
jgi:hypothetical protein